MVGCIYSIKEGVIYFRYFIGCQEERELRWMRQEKEHDIRDAHELEEQMRMDELVWQ